MTKGLAFKIGSVLARGIAEHDITGEPVRMEGAIREALRLIELRVGDTRAFSAGGAVEQARVDIERELGGEVE